MADLYAQIKRDAAAISRERADSEPSYSVGFQTPYYTHNGRRYSMLMDKEGESFVINDLRSFADGLHELTLLESSRVA